MVGDETTRGARRRVQHPVAALLAAVVFVAAAATSYRLAFLQHLDDLAASRAEVASRLDHVRGDLSRELFASINLAEGLVTLVRHRVGIQQEEFEALAAAMLKRSPIIRNIALAPGTVIRFVYPLQGNEAALGVDYMGVPNQRKMVRRAIDEKRTVVAGPLALIQGGTGIIGRTPIFYQLPAGPAGPGGEGYWGIAATVISFDRLLSISGLDAARRTLRISLRGLDGTGAEGPAFWGDTDVFGQQPVLMAVPLPSGSWVIAGTPTGGWPAFLPWRSREFLAGLSLSTALAALLFQVMSVSRQRRCEVQARQRTEVELRDVNRALAIKEFAIESVASGIALVGLDGRVTYSNRPFAPMLGRMDDDMAGTRLSDALGAAAAALVEHALASSGTWRGEFTAPGPEGGIAELEGAADTVRGEGGEPLGWILILQDVTGRKRMMAEVERGQRLSALSVFAGGVAHDFNNLLGAVFGNIELARSSLPGDSPVLSHLETASAAFERARDLTRRLLTFAVGSPPERRRLTPVSFLRECCSLSLSGSMSQWEIDATDGDRTWDVFGDANQLSQVFTNLLVNARQAMSHGGHVRLTVRNREVAAGEVPDLGQGRYVEVLVADDGPGIPPDVLPRVFDPFFTTKPSGTGLGLAMCHSIMSAHAGRIVASSLVGGGATFSLLLPAAPLAHAEGPPQAAVAKADEPSCGRILLMDDEPLIRGMASRMLARGGYDVVAARNGEEAIALCHEALAAGTPFDAAILDVTVPGGMGGADTLRHLRIMQPDLAVVLSSGYGEIKMVAGESHATAVLPKPYQMHELLACARAVIRKTPPTVVG